MASSPLRMRNLLLLSLALAPLATYAQETTADLPSLSASTSDAESTTAESTAETTEATTTAATTDATTTAETTADDSTTTDAATTDDASSQTTTTASFTTDPSSTTTESGLTDLPTLAGAGVPELFIPYTAPAPFMQKSNYPEGTVFIAVDAVLAFLGACVLVWRGMVAWSINRSVKKAAMASIRGASEKPSAFGGSSTSGYQPVGGGGGKGGGGGGGIYQDTAYGSSMSLDALTSAGKPLKAPGAHFRDGDRKRDSSVPPPGLFFSPTAQAAGGAGAGTGARESMRNSQMLPAGYYASPSAQAGGGAGSMTIGGDHRASTLAPYARHSSYNASPPESPSHNPYRHSVAGAAGGARASSHDRGRLRASRDGYGASSARNSYFDPASARHSAYLDPGAASGAHRNSRHSGIYGQQQAGSRSSLAVGGGGGGRQSRHASRDDLGGSRAPSAYLEDLFDHSTGMQER